MLHERLHKGYIHCYIIYADSTISYYLQLYVLTSQNFTIPNKNTTFYKNIYFKTHQPVIHVHWSFGASGEVCQPKTITYRKYFIMLQQFWQTTRKTTPRHQKTTVTSLTWWFLVSLSGKNLSTTNRRQRPSHHDS